ncbi:hypothetical protein, unlikely [Trypanosoma brucei gambiense DAL972]|uniref:Uncharacterized protein n=1 Tax=Trypanosoma brucei gambiense (strain MHOM/CI/86/DAL972) TaxID=679716 RepID=C9ZU49_TRYB9|nr:hypothetical protein, unlikely [Trypanosoma brucei gambiense DAL972]CBH12935.1 hypothetical protein, unlikely [Trypanosoma brucei gambiense DAL972]|eukprot:XP_011775214.1 hypothetical protein, unlikely [Trypanosoma brucei gambiense DAL972]
MDFLLRIFTVYFPSVKHPRKSNLLLSPTSKLHPLPMAVNAMRRSFKLIMAHHQPPLCISVNASLFVRQIVANHFYFYLAFCAEPRICLLQNRAAPKPLPPSYIIYLFTNRGIHAAVAQYSHRNILRMSAVIIAIP